MNFKMILNTNHIVYTYICIFSNRFIDLQVKPRMPVTYPTDDWMRIRWVLRSH